MSSQVELWIFGYGSLIWRPDFEHVESAVACAEGWVRRFYQGSVDHRGVPGAPGRVVTLLSERGARCWGRAFRVAAERREALLARLDRREVGGYDRVELSVELPERGVRVQALTYIAAPDNPNYLGPAPLEQVVGQVRAAVGPSGPNVEYVLRLAEALEAMGAADAHVAELARQLRASR